MHFEFVNKKTKFSLSFSEAGRYQEGMNINVQKHRFQNANKKITNRFEELQESSNLNQLPPLPLNIFNQGEEILQNSNQAEQASKQIQVNKRQRRIKQSHNDQEPFSQMISRGKAHFLDTKGLTKAPEVIIQPKYNQILKKSLLTDLDEKVKERKKEIYQKVYDKKKQESRINIRERRSNTQNNSENYFDSQINTSVDRSIISNQNSILTSKIKGYIDLEKQNKKNIDNFKVNIHEKRFDFLTTPENLSSYQRTQNISLEKQVNKRNEETNIGDLVYEPKYTAILKKGKFYTPKFEHQIRRKHKVKEFQNSIIDLRETYDDFGKKKSQVRAPNFSKVVSRQHQDTSLCLSPIRQETSHVNYSFNL